MTAPGTATTATSPASSPPAARDAHAGSAPLDTVDGTSQMNGRAEPLGEPPGDELVSARDARAVVAAVGADAGELAGRDPVADAPGRHLETGEDRLAGARVEVEPGQQLGGRERGVAALRDGGRDGVDGAGEDLGLDAEPAARLTLAVAHALLPQPEPEAAAQVEEHVVSGQDELRAPLDHGPVRKLGRPDPAADPVARLEHDDLVSSPGQLVGSGQAREAGADHDGSRAHGGHRMTHRGRAGIPVRRGRVPQAGRLACARRWRAAASTSSTS